MDSDNMYIGYSLPKIIKNSNGATNMGISEGHIFELPCFIIYMNKI